MAEIGFLLKAKIEGTLPRSGNIDLINSGWPKASQTLGCPHQSTVEAYLKRGMEINEEMIKRDGM